MEDVIQIDDKWYILATSQIVSDRTWVLKSEETFGFFDAYGDIQQIGLGEQGLYHAGTRYLSTLEFTINGKRPLLLNSSIAKDNLLLAVDFTTPDLYNNDTVQVKMGTVHVFRSKILTEKICHEHFRIVNYGLSEVELTLGITFNADYYDIFEVRGTTRKRRGRLQAPTATDSAIRLGYRGLDEVNRATVIDLSPPPNTIEQATAIYRFVLSVHEEKEFFVTLKSPNLDLAGVKLPQVVKGTGEEALYDRMFLYEELVALIWALFGRFAQIRADSAWQERILPELETWVLRSRGEGAEE